MEQPVCDLCGGDDREQLLAGGDWRQPVPAGMALVRCRACGLMYLSPRPDTSEIERYYPPEYAPFKPAIEDERLAIMRWIRRRKLLQRKYLVEQFSGRTKGRLLDVGCATGLFLHEMALGGWEVCGVEPSAAAASYARRRFGLDVHLGQLDDGSFDPPPFEVITFWDVLEHTFSPAAALARARTLLRDGGLVAVNVPNWQSLGRRLFGPHWIGLDPPRHMYVFTVDTLTRMLGQAGFRVMAWRCFMSSYYPFVISLDNMLKVRAPRRAGTINRILNVPGMRYVFEPAFTVANWAGRGEVIAVFARKEG